MSTSPERARRVSLADVARIAGVSSNTVSRVVRGDPEVADATRKRISDILEQVGYRPNFAARALAAKRTGIIQVILAAPMFHGHGQTLLAVMNEAAEAGFSVVVSNAYGNEELPEIVVVPFDVDGVIILGGQRSTTDFAVRTSRFVPTILLLSNEEKLRGVSTVSVDNEWGSYIAARHLIDNSCRQIVHIQGAIEWSDAQKRRQGCERACEEAGIDFCVVPANSWDAKHGYEVMMELLRQHDTAIPQGLGVVAANDQLALGITRAAHEKGIHVPREMKIVGFDDAEGALCFVPPLSTVRQPFDKVGREAVKQLRNLLAGKAPQDILIEPELVIRASSTH